MNRKPTPPNLRTPCGDENSYRLQALRVEPSTKSTIDSMAKLAGVVDRLSERLYGSADTASPRKLKEFYDRVKMRGVDPHIRPITDLAKDGGTWSGDGRDSPARPG